MIDRKPEVGRIVLTEGYGMFTFCHKGGLITKVTTSRVYYKEGNAEHFILKFAAVCDTIEEEKQLLDFQEQCNAELRILRASQREQWNKLVGKEVMP